MDWQEQANATEARLRGQLLAALEGDARAYRTFLSALGAHLRAYFRKRLFDLPDDVEDLVQETLLSIHTHRHTYRTELPLTAWVHTIARYRLVDLLRARSRREALHDPLDDGAAFFASADLDALEARRDLGTLTAHLPARQREALYRVKVDGASMAEAATAMGMTETAVKVTVHRGLKALMARARSSE
ncbi:sigma-70 family RNA polymerase sigma factor [Caenimonas sedimenti]|uniref:Sigma-70 family RNA polymerase sigma factor n=1 Tax=Caenimonas sedimenti TaxID=2596921 RepID=A0A562ZTS1_9BURK|nr:sigma-70 family RNA polymerase sigma factor [Caenimonas sedimenti]TWO71756.1 sigma-70 family RNA polymerase sigma factor [Caenimonas sedimenti]